MDRKPMATIIIPVYNAQAYLEKCLDSALQQTYDNYEIICVNDQSPDDSQRILEEYGKKYSEKLHYICNEENIGHASRMRAIAMAKGEYIFFLDSDDYLDQDYLETFMREVQEEDYDVVVAGFKRIMPDKTVDHDIIESEFTRVCYTVACCKMYRKDFILQHRIDFTDQRIGEDIFFTLSFYCSKARTKFIHYFGYNYLYNPKSTTGALRYNKHFERVAADMFARLMNRYPMESLEEEQRYLVEYAYVSTMTDALLHYGRGAKPALMKEMHAFVLQDMYEKFPDIKSNPYFRIRGLEGPEPDEQDRCCRIYGKYQVASGWCIVLAGFIDIGGIWLV